jgi:hypothetical protein
LLSEASYWNTIRKSSRVIEVALNIDLLHLKIDHFKDHCNDVVHDDISDLSNEWYKVYFLEVSADGFEAALVDCFHQTVFSLLCHNVPGEKLLVGSGTGHQLCHM